MGGRAYGWWQSLPKERRRQLLLNGEPVAEPDFTQMHPAILYAQRGSRLEGDAYETGEFARQDGKLAFNVALNAKSRQGAISALCNKAGWKLSGQQTSRLIEALKRRNAPIAPDLHSDKGVRLMQMDSEITLRAVKGCMRAGIPVLPIHDSMLTPARYEGRVAEIMEESAATVLKAVSPCSVRVSGSSIPQMPSPWVSLGSSGVSFGPTQLSLFPELTMADPISFGRHLSERRRQRGLSQRDLAVLLGCRQPHIANVERGHDRLGEWARRLREVLRAAA